MPNANSCLTFNPVECMVNDLEEQARNLVWGDSDKGYKFNAILKLLQERERMKDWLWQYREELKSTNVFHKNEAIIHNINKLIP